MGKLLVKYGNNHFRVNTTNDNTKIFSSYKITSFKDIKAFLLKVRSMTSDDYAVSKRSLFGMILEWRAHNLLYSLHLFRSHTKDVDLEYPQKWYMKSIWFCLGIF